MNTIIKYSLFIVMFWLNACMHNSSNSSNVNQVGKTVEVQGIVDSVYYSKEGYVACITTKDSQNIKVTINKKEVGIDNYSTIKKGNKIILDALRLSNNKYYSQKIIFINKAIAVNMLTVK